MEVHLYGFLFFFENLSTAAERIQHISIQNELPRLNVVEVKATTVLKMGGLMFTSDLSLMRAGPSVQVEEAIAVGAEVTTNITQDDGCCLTIIVIVAHRL